MTKKVCVTKMKVCVTKKVCVAKMKVCVTKESMTRWVSGMKVHVIMEVCVTKSGQSQKNSQAKMNFVRSVWPNGWLVEPIWVFEYFVWGPKRDHYCYCV